MSFMLWFLIPLVVLIAGAAVYDLKRRRRHAPGHDIDSAARATRAAAEGRGSAGSL